jgi:hypothetical protein
MNTIEQQEEALFAKWRGQERNWVKDGVVNPEIFAASAPKVLYILKEANGRKEKKWQDGDLRAFLKKADRWQTWNTVARWQYAITHLKEEIDWKKANYISKSFRKTLLKSIAVINLKKEPGNQQSDMQEIKAFALKDLDYIKEQISIYKPDIVICGGTGDIAKELQLLGSFSKWEKSDRDVEYCNVNNTTILNYKHPGVRASKQTMFWDVAHTLREARIA